MTRLINSPIALNGAMTKSKVAFIVSEEGDVDASGLTKKHCVPFEEGTKPFDLETINNLLPTVLKWRLEDQKKDTQKF